MTSSYPITPMKATLGKLPSGAQDDAWAYEIKWDGHRTVLHLDGDRTIVQSAGGHNVGGRWPELTVIQSHINASTAILDGEVVVLGADGLPSFDLVQRRHRRGRLNPTDDGEPPAGLVMFYAFDVLSIDGTETTELPYLHRRRLLSALVENGPHWTVPDHRTGGGAELVAATANLGMEGVIAKRVDSSYRVGVRTKDWLKIKHRRVIHLPVGGYTPGTGSRSAVFGSLLLGHPRIDNGVKNTIRFAGAVGTGFKTQTLNDLTEVLTSIASAECPYDPPLPRTISRTATWVEPGLTARVEITEFTNNGHVRHARFISYDYQLTTNLG